MGGRKYPNLDPSLVDEVFDRLGGVEGARRFLSGRLEFVEVPDLEHPEQFSVEIGRYKSAHEYVEGIHRAALEIRARAEHALGSIEIHREARSVHLVPLTLEELGFEKGTSDYSAIMSAAFKKGLRLCPQEAAVARRLALLRQPRCQILNFASRLMEDSEGRSVIFRLTGGDTPELGVISVDHQRWFGNNIFVFAKP